MPAWLAGSRLEKVKQQDWLSLSFPLHIVCPRGHVCTAYPVRPERLFINQSPCSNTHIAHSQPHSHNTQSVILRANWCHFEEAVWIDGRVRLFTCGGEQASTAYGRDEGQSAVSSVHLIVTYGPAEWAHCTRSNIQTIFYKVSLLSGQQTQNCYQFWTISIGQFTRNCTGQLADCVFWPNGARFNKILSGLPVQWTHSKLRTFFLCKLILCPNRMILQAKNNLNL